MLLWKGFEQQNLAKPSDGQDILFLYKPVIDVVRHLFANMDPGYHLHPVVRKNMRGERIYAGLETAEWWHRAQVRIATLSCFWSYLYMFYSWHFLQI